MALTKYTYSISGDFPVDIPALMQEIVSSAIAEVLSRIDVDVSALDTCDIWFDNALSAGDQVILDGIVAAHQGEPPTTQIVYLRTGGDGDGSSPNNAFGSMEDILAALPLRPRVAGQKVRVDCTGFDWTVDEHRDIPSFEYGDSTDLDVTGNAYDFNRFGLEFFAEPQLAQSITINSVTPDAKLTGLLTLDVAEVLVPNAHVDQMIYGSALAQYGVVISNTANQVVVQTYSGGAFTAPVGLYDVGSTWDVGDAGNFFDTKLCQIALCSLSMVGIRIVQNFRIHPSSNVSLVGCVLEDFSLGPGVGYLTADACVFRGKLFIDAVGHEIRSSSVHDLDFLSHGMDYQAAMFQDCVLDTVTDFGAGASLSSYVVDVNRLLIRNAPGNGITLRGADVSRVRNSTIKDCGGSGISAENGNIQVNNVDGNGNADYGIELSGGAQAAISGGTSVTGASGDVLIGGLAAATAYAGLPLTDMLAALPQFCRAG